MSGEPSPTPRVTVDLTVTTDELTALLRATFTQDNRITQMINMARDAMLMEAVTALSDDLAMVRSAQRKIREVLAAQSGRRKEAAQQRSEQEQQ